ncbi:hypothetical protein Y032_0042g519 [Ancylostoma ceylanicum]|uniref:Uncharacterized protein n=1 Tax=Ancylostoma ceylanicum TaxID=53326 RepID=A0A016UEM2_9BILA|nr:hypothetical protein Y032_0042g519 [Ancylostoma ceylanicum]
MKEIPEIKKGEPWYTDRKPSWLRRPHGDRLTSKVRVSVCAAFKGSTRGNLCIGDLPELWDFGDGKLIGMNETA